VLLNGHRLAPGNLYGNWIDVSLIPLAGVDRVDVVSDGASAIYGSDAVGGVVNFILRRDVEGFEARGRYGAGIDGGPDEVQGGLTVGHRWSSGSALASYEYLGSPGLRSTDRDYTNTARQPFSLLPKQLRHGVIVALDQSMSDSLDAFANLTYAHRSTRNFNSSPIGFQNSWSADVSGYSGTLGGRLHLTDELTFELSSSYASSDTRQTIASVPTGAVLVGNQINTSITSIDTQLDGSLWTLPAGSVRFALGGQYRRELFDSENALSGQGYNPSRDVVAAFL
jgi:outer membrane receptor protein involved in Fe transport